MPGMTQFEEFQMWEVVKEVMKERKAQHERWGEQNHPFHSPTKDQDAWDYDAQTEWLAKEVCERADRNGTLSFSDILLEEVAECQNQRDELKLETELIQVAAVAVAAVEALRRKRGAK